MLDHFPQIHVCSFEYAVSSYLFIIVFSIFVFYYFDLQGFLLNICWSVLLMLHVNNFILKSFFPHRPLSPHTFFHIHWPHWNLFISLFFNYKICIMFHFLFLLRHYLLCFLYFSLHSWNKLLFLYVSWALTPLFSYLPCPQTHHFWVFLILRLFITSVI